MELFKSFSQGMTDYIIKHNANYSLIEENINNILGVLTGQVGGDISVPTGLKEIFDRKGLIGIDSYNFNEGTLSGPDYILTVNAGAYWSGTAFKHKTSTTPLSLAERSTGTYYIYLDNAGAPALDVEERDDTIWTFDWNASNQMSI